MTDFLLEKIKECEKLIYPKRHIRRRYEDYEIAAMTVVSAQKRNPRYLGEIYFIKKDKHNISSFTLSFLEVSDNKLIGEIIKNFREQKDTISIGFGNKTGINELLCNSTVMKEIQFSVNPNPQMNSWYVRNGSFYFNIPDEEFKEKLGTLFINIKVNEKVFKDQDPVIRDKIKSAEIGIKTLQKEIKKWEKQIKELNESDKVFQNMKSTIKDYMGEDEWSAQKLLFEFTKGSFK